GSINRFLTIDGVSHEWLVVTPGQFQATGNVTATIGTERLYDKLTFEVYHAPFTATDFLAPSIAQVQAISSTNAITFHIQLSDDSGSVSRVVVLYRDTKTMSWKKVEPTYNQFTGSADASIPLIRGQI